MDRTEPGPTLRIDAYLSSPTRRPTGGERQPEAYGAKPVAEPQTNWDPLVKERWFCSWCYAWTELGHDPQEVSRPQYQPMNGRCERAESPELPEDVGHAYDEASAYEGFGTTLCGIRHDGLSASPYPWMPNRPDACQSCEEAAGVIDRRWPLEMRDGKRIHPTPPPGSRWPPF